MPAGWCNGASAGGAQPPPQLEVDLVGGGDRAEGEASRWGWRSCWSPFCCSHQQGTPWDCPPASLTTLTLIALSIMIDAPTSYSL